MTLANLIRRYKRWNPVHPTIGAFWGLGVGLGCGVGWGPGFGHEAVGFVGSGCGVGFNVGVTFIGFGVGLPSSGLTCVPWNAFVWTGKGASNVTSTFVLPALVFTAKQTWEALSFQASAIDRSMQNLYNTQIPRRRKFLLESRKRFLRKAKDSRNKVVTHDSRVLQLQPLDGNQLNGAPPRPQTVSLTSPRSTSAQSNSPRDFLPPASRQVQSQHLPEDSKRQE